MNVRPLGVNPRCVTPYPARYPSVLFIVASDMTSGEMQVPDYPTLQKYWKVDSKSVIVTEDASNAQILSFAYSSAVKQQLSSDFFLELQVK